LGASLKTSVETSLNLLTTAIPAALPVAMSAGVIFAINRLKNKNIFCTSPPRMNVAGQIDTFVFDKTGTLTEEGLTVLGFRPTVRSDSNCLTTFKNFTSDAKTLTPKGRWWNGENGVSCRSQNSTLFAEALASCTAITFIDEKLVGDPLDVQMFEATGWTLDETDHSRIDSDGHLETIIAYVYPKDA